MEALKQRGLVGVLTLHTLAPAIVVMLSPDEHAVNFIWTMMESLNVSRPEWLVMLIDYFLILEKNA